MAADGAALETRLSLRKRAAEPRPERLHLASPKVLDGRILAVPDRDPVAEALVWLERAPTEAVRADERGNYRLEVLPWHDGRLRGAAPGHLSERSSSEIAGDLEAAPTLVLYPAGAVVGVVVDAEGRKLPGAEIRTRFDLRALGPGLFNPPHRQRQTGGRARSDEVGRFRLGNLVPGLEYELRVELPGFPPERITVKAPEPAQPADPVRIVLNRDLHAVGRVVDGERRPVPQAHVALSEARPGDLLDRAWRMENPLPSVVAVTDREGRFEIGPLAPGVLDLEVAAPGFVTARVRGLEIEANGGQPLDLGTVVLPPEAVVRGRVVGPEGDALAGAAVTIVPDEPLLAVVQDRAASPADAFSGGDGSFELGGFRSGQVVKLRVDLEGYGLAVVPAARAGGDPVTVVLEPARPLSGRVEDADGSPVSGALVRVDPLDYLEVTGGQIPSAARVNERWDRTGDDGRFRIEGVAPGFLEVVVSAPGWQQWVRRLDPWRGDGDGELEVVLESAAVVTGVVVAASGQPAIGAEIRRWAPPLPEGAMHYETPLGTTDGDGRYRIDDLPPGRVRLEARHTGKGRAVRDLEAVAGENLLDFQLEAAGGVSGLVVDRDGSPVAGARVVLGSHLASWVPPRVVSDAAGRFEIRGLAAGRYTLEARKPGVGRSRTAVPFELRDEPVDGLVVEVSPTGTVTGRLFGLAPEELAGVRIHAGPLLDVGAVDFEGRYRISDLSPGTWTIVAEVVRTGRRAMGEVEIDPDNPDAHLDLDLRGGLTLSGSVAFEGEPWPGGAITVFGPGGVSASTRTDRSGRFELLGLQAGAYVLEVVIPRHQVRRRLEVTLESDREIPIDVSAAPGGELAGGSGANGVLEH